MDVDRARLAVGRIAPHRLEQGLAAVDPAGMARERVQHLELDVRELGPLAVDRDAPVGFERIDVRFEIDAPEASAEQIAKLVERTERYCVVLQTLLAPPPIRTTSG